ncbi:hypothetical protein ACFSUP_15140 [Gracilibacillus thailandensis]|nr:hypothetical protein [Gracilibacillus thailandensis]
MYTTSTYQLFEALAVPFLKNISHVSSVDYMGIWHSITYRPSFPRSCQTKMTLLLLRKFSIM